MDKVSGFLFKHFEKIMLVMMILWFVGIWYHNSVESGLRQRCEAAGGVYVGEGQCVAKEAMVQF